MTYASESAPHSAAMAAPRLIRSTGAVVGAAGMNVVSAAMEESSSQLSCVKMLAAGRKLPRTKKASGACWPRVSGMEESSTSAGVMMRGR